MGFRDVYDGKKKSRKGTFRGEWGFDTPWGFGGVKNFIKLI